MKLSRDGVVFLFCSIAAVLWLGFEYGQYVGKAEQCAPTEKPRVEFKQV